MDLLESGAYQSQKSSFPLIFLLYDLHVDSKCLTLPAKCCKNLSFDLTDGKHLLVYEAHPPGRKATHQTPFSPVLEFQVLIAVLTKPAHPSLLM